MKKSLLNSGLPIGFLIIAILSIGSGCTSNDGVHQPTNVDNDGNAFTTVVIGTQTWMQKNLDVARYRNGDLIPQVTDATAWAGLTTGAWCYYQNDTANGPVYGRLYNWYAVNDSRGVAPIGYHVPSDAEWTNLMNYLGGDSVAGGGMKSTTGWDAPNTGATNSSGFTCLPNGGRDEFGTYDEIGIYSYIWSTTENTTDSAWQRIISYDNSGVIRNFSSKKVGNSVRCVKD